MSLPWEFDAPIHTDRLTLRLARPEDVDEVLDYQGREDVSRYLLHEARSRGEVVEALATYAAATRIAEDHDWIEPVIELDGRVIGHMYLQLASAENLQGEIGWTLHPDFSGRGYATEASRAMLDLAFDTIGLHRMRAELDPRNDTSIALCLRLGMRHEATFRQDLWFKGAWGDTGVYAILAEEWATRKPDTGPSLAE